MNQVYILVGKIASGKTTWADHKAKEEKCVLLSHDDLMLVLADDCEGRAAHVDRAKRISKYYAKLSASLVDQEISVILDYGFWTKEERGLITAELTKYNVPYTMLYITCSEENRIQRLEKRNQDLLRSDQREYVIPTVLRERLDAFFEEPCNENIEVVYMD
ncbi:MAG: ATP-binding protein [Erysipelotrichaceae bacterium]|nr:ATP-binding protein [Erysipelotrichaceae bacterium]